VGRLSVEKGIDDLLAAWERLGDRVVLKIVGDGPLADRVARATRKLGGVEWLGRQPRDRVLALMKEAAMLVFPSVCYEGFPLVIAEAFAVGLPVVASDLGSAASLGGSSPACVGRPEVSSRLDTPPSRTIGSCWVSTAR
jgi:glycosyltransferase involved in cell wall biosynthesis